MLFSTRESLLVAEAVRYKQWVKDDIKTRFVILSSLDRSQHQHILTCQSVKEMWDLLVTIHERELTYEYHIDPTDNVATHFPKIKNFSLHLLDLRESISDLTIKAKILSSLPSKFRNFRSEWSSVDPDRQTLEHQQERL